MSVDVARGQAGETVRFVQERLNGTGFGPLEATGRFGAETEVAVATFQLVFRLPVTGAVDDRTWELLTTATWTAPDGHPERLFEGVSFAALGVLRRGSRGPLVRILQEASTGRGVATEADGDFGPATEAAVRAFQAGASLTADGVVGPLTWAALLCPGRPAATVVPGLAPGARGDDVRWVQSRLAALGYGPLSVDGVYGPITAAIVAQYQLVHGLPTTGIVDADTRIALMSASRVPMPETVAAELRAEQRLRAEVILGEGEPDRAARLAVVERALAKLGAREEPDGSNGGPQLAEMVDGYYPPDVEAKLGKPPWCALAVTWWVTRGLGVASYTEPPFGARFGAVEQYRQWARERGGILPATGPAPTGAVFVMAREGSSSDPTTSPTAGHCGVVIADEGERVCTVEGNVSNAVRLYHRTKRTLQGYVRWW